MFDYRKAVAALVGACSLCATAAAPAQTLHAPSRTLFKCQEHGRTVYSDSPCLGAEKLEVVPARGVSKLSGSTRIGADVQNEVRREMMAEALRPLTGMDARQFEVQMRRQPLPVAAQQACRRLDQELAGAEAEEKQASRVALRDVQARLLLLRQRFRELRC